MSDYMVKALGYNKQVRAYAARTTDMVNEAVRRSQAWPTAAAALGRAITAGSMMGSMLKGEEKLTIKIEGGGPMGAIVVDSQSNGNTRGYTHNPNVHFDLNQHGKLDVARAVGTSGTLSVVKDLGMQEQFTGHVPLVSGEIGDDFTYYFASSEQVPSSVGLGVLVNPDETVLAAGGFILQVLPEAEDTLIEQIETHLQHLPPLSKLIEKGKTPEEVLHLLLGDDYQILETAPVAFECHCSRERISQALIGLGEEELRAMIEEDEGAETECQFCHEVYNFSKQDLEELAVESPSQNSY
ncbi:Hsp33 family molecular chaperone HslO [Salsuginibacillus kocurii]|uniref:Hsp33 family molecular chaperone HslO n=1 Tax=Salsuginibacillus kocurii TaxID=427078 RepID=UPI00038131BE|nr:Hsp33 family molecular chaperone HslO [Salsuginibacillus kocurii]